MIEILVVRSVVRRVNLMGVIFAFRCSQHGQCHVSGELMWECRCYEGWDGADCSVPLEQSCGDNKDNDRGQ